MSARPARRWPRRPKGDFSSATGRSVERVCVVTDDRRGAPHALPRSKGGRRRLRPCRRSGPGQGGDACPTCVACHGRPPLPRTTMRSVGRGQAVAQVSPVTLRTDVAMTSRLDARLRGRPRISRNRLEAQPHRPLSRGARNSTSPLQDTSRSLHVGPSDRPRGLHGSTVVIPRGRLGQIDGLKPCEDGARKSCFRRVDVGFFGLFAF